MSIPVTGFRDAGSFVAGYSTIGWGDTRRALSQLHGVRAGPPWLDTRSSRELLNNIEVIAATRHDQMPVVGLDAFVGLYPIQAPSHPPMTRLR